MRKAPAPSDPPRSPRLDPFRLLAILCIVLGMTLVIAAAVFYFLTHQASALIVGAGVTMSTGGGIGEYLARIASQIPDYDEPPEQRREERERRRRR